MGVNQREGSDNREVASGKLPLRLRPRGCNPHLMRRVWVAKVTVGRIPLGKREAHHLRDVLRLGPGAEIEVFNEAGLLGRGKLVAAEKGNGIEVEVEQVESPVVQGCRLTIASAVPKGARADWMIEKLSEIGVLAFVPIISLRSVVEPRGTGKMERWKRIAAEAARQSGRVGIMRIDNAVQLEQAINPGDWYLSFLDDAVSILELTANLPQELKVFVGPEGGWADEELADFARKRARPVRLTSTVLRVETAAVVAAGIIASR
jgi:16S rRNA (uracil1498-N3)-methyltransferase